MIPGHASILLLVLASCADPAKPEPEDSAPPTDDTAHAPDSAPDSAPDTGAGGETADTGPAPCAAEVPDAGTVEVDAACTISALPEDPWDVETESWWIAPAEAYGVYVMPAVGQLTDDDGDGDVDEDDVPDIAFTAGYAGLLVVLSGDGSGEILSESGHSGSAGVAIADVDGDGTPEIVAVTAAGEVVALDAAGTRLWTSEPFEYLFSYRQPAVADLDGDGTVEIVFDRAILSGADGATLAEIPDPVDTWRAPVVADLDGDGSQEILLGKSAFSASGALLWSVSAAGWADFQAVADLDGDGAPEIVLAGQRETFVLEADGTVAVTLPVGDQAGPPAVADFDGDGTSEIAISASSTVTVLEGDGTVLWTQAVEDSGSAGCSAFDLDLDGAAEVLFAGSVEFAILDGRTGEKRFSDLTHSSSTIFEYPVAADVDADGSAEIVVASSGMYGSGIKVYGHVDGGWPPAGGGWGIHDFAATNLAEDGTVPSPADRWWTADNLFRSRPAGDMPPIPTPDLVLEVAEVCAPSCEHEPVEVTWQVSNRGLADVTESPWISLYSRRGADEVLLETRAVGPVPAGAALPGGTFLVDPAAWGDGLMISLDDDGSRAGTVTECDEADNVLRLDENPCEPS